MVIESAISGGKVSKKKKKKKKLGGSLVIKRFSYKFKTYFFVAFFFKFIS